MDYTNENTLRDHLVELLAGGFAPTVILLREFHFDKAGVVLDGLHFSAWILLGHMRYRQKILLDYMKDPEMHSNVWPDAHWPDNHQPKSSQDWNSAISDFERELNEMISIVKNPNINLLQVHQNGKTVAWAVMTAFHHNSYHIGQLKTIGRQLGVWVG